MARLAILPDKPTSNGLYAAALKHIAGHRCEVQHADKKPCFDHFPKDRHQWCWPCYSRYVIRTGKSAC